MPKPIEFRPAMGSPEDHLNLAKVRVASFQEELQRAVEAQKPEAQIAGLRDLLAEAQENLEKLELETGSKAA